MTTNYNYCQYSCFDLFFHNKEAQRLEQINHANGEAAAMVAVAEARAVGLNKIAKS